MLPIVPGIANAPVNLLHPLNAAIPILIRFEERVNDPVKLLHPANAWTPILVTVKGRFNGPVNPEHPLNAAAEIVVTAGGIVGNGPILGLIPVIVVPPAENINAGLDIVSLI